MDIDRINARKIIDVCSQGNPPEYGFSLFTAGLDHYTSTIQKEYIDDFIKNGGSSFKVVIGVYGGGKTHFLYCIRELAWKQDYITSYIVLSPEETPFHKLELVYKTIVTNLVFNQSPEKMLSSYERGIETVIKRWYFSKYREFQSKGKNGDALIQELRNYILTIGQYESISYRNAIVNAFLALVEKRDDSFSLICQWLQGENPPKILLKQFNIFEKIDKSTAFRMIRSTVQWLKEIGYTGLILLFDEAEQTPSMSTKQKSLLMNNLRELIDECGHSNFTNTMIFYAVPDENFLEGKSQIYEALRQRITTVFDGYLNPTGVKIILEKTPMTPIEQLTEIGIKLSEIYSIAYGCTFSEDIRNQTIKNIAEGAYERKLDVGYKRSFVKKVISAFHLVNRENRIVTYAEVDI